MPSVNRRGSRLGAGGEISGTEDGSREEGEGSGKNGRREADEAEARSYAPQLPGRVIYIFRLLFCTSAVRRASALVLSSSIGGDFHLQPEPHVMHTTLYVRIMGTRALLLGVLNYGAQKVDFQKFF